MISINNRDKFNDYLNRELAPGTAKDYLRMLENKQVIELVNKYCDKWCEDIYAVSDCNIIQSWLDELLLKQYFTAFVKRTHNKPTAAFRRYIDFLKRKQ